MKSILSITLFLLLFTACKKDKIAPVPYSTTFGISSYSQAKEELKMYAKYGVYTDGVSKLWLDKLLNLQTTGQVLTNYRADIDSDRSDGGDFYMDNIKSTYQEEVINYIPELDGFSGDAFALGEYLKNNVFGKDTNFKLIREGQAIYDETIYLPSGIEIFDFPNTGVSDGSTFFQISRDDFSITWNADRENKNGVLVLLLWSGNLSSDSLNELGQGSGTYYQKALWLEDTGHGNIPISFFAAVPSGALFSLNLWRANIEIIRGTDDRTYKIYGISEDKKNCVLLD